MFKIISESGVAAGVRRIEAVTGKGVLEYINNSDRLIEKTAAALKINQINEIDHKAESVMAQCRDCLLYTSSVFSTKKVWYVVYEKNRIENMLVFEPSQKMVEKIKSRAKNSKA